MTASRNMDLEADQAVFSVAVDSGFDKNLDDILNALPGTGITAANLAGISTQPYPLPPRLGAAPLPMLAWMFRLPVPLSKVKDTTALLTSLQQSIAQKGGGLSLSFQVQGTQISPQAAQSQVCNPADLLADARAQAQKLASAAGLAPGAILGLVSSAPSPSLPGACSLTVRFALGATFGQPDPNAITITALRNLTATPDQVSFALTVVSSANSGLNEITASLQNAGIAGAIFTGVYTSQGYTPAVGSQPPAVLQWLFQMTAPLARIKDTFGLLTAAQQAIAANNSGLSLTFSTQGLQTSPDAQKSVACPQTDLVSDARAQAQKVAAAAGVSVGPVLSMSGGNPVGVPIPTNVISASRAGDFTGASSGSFLLGVISSAPLTSFGYTCSLAVQFQLLR